MATCSGAVDGNYTISYVDSTVTVAPAPLTVTASSGSQAYGSAAPDITPAYSGFVNGDTAASLTTPATCLSAALPTSPVGSYDSSCSGAADPNYTIGYVDGTVAIAPAALTVTASSDSAAYGGTTPIIDPQVSGLQNNEDVSVLGADLWVLDGGDAEQPGRDLPVHLHRCVRRQLFDQLRGRQRRGGACSRHRDRIVGVVHLWIDPPAITPTVTGLQNSDTVSSLGGGLTCATPQLALRWPELPEFLLGCCGPRTTRSATSPASSRSWRPPSWWLPARVR